MLTRRTFVLGGLTVLLAACSARQDGDSATEDEPAGGLDPEPDAAEEALETTEDTSGLQAEALESDAESEQDMKSITITVNGTPFAATLADTDAAAAFARKLPLTLEMSELNGNEKYCYTGDALPAAASCPGRIEAGDLMLYGSDCVVLFYESFATSYSYTPLGAIDDPSGIAEAVGSGTATVSFE